MTSTCINKLQPIYLENVFIFLIVNEALSIHKSLWFLGSIVLVLEVRKLILRSLSQMPSHPSSHLICVFNFLLLNRLRGKLGGDPINVVLGHFHWSLLFPTAMRQRRMKA